jgi:hypothetical protein
MVVSELLPMEPGVGGAQKVRRTARAIDMRVALTD